MRKRKMKKCSQSAAPAACAYPARPRTYFSLVTPNGDPIPAPAPAQGNIYLNSVCMPVYPMANGVKRSADIKVLGWEDFDDFDF